MIPTMTEVFHLDEAKCPYCGSKGAYVGATTVECDNPKCGHYKAGPPNKAASTVWQKICPRTVEEGTAQERALKAKGWEIVPTDNPPLNVAFDPKHWSNDVGSPGISGAPPKNMIYTGYIQDSVLAGISPEAKDLVKRIHDSAQQGRDDVNDPHTYDVEDFVARYGGP